MTIKDAQMAPRLAVVDPALTYTLPKKLAASTGMDAFVHAIEAYTCRAATPFSDIWAERAMALIFKNLRAAVLEGDRQAKDARMLGSTMAGVAFSHADVAAVHCLAEALGGLYDTPHGVANSIFLPFVTAFNAKADVRRHAAAARLCGLAGDGQPDDEAAALLVRELRVMSSEVGIPLLRDLGCVNPTDFSRLAEASFINGSTPDNCREITADDYRALLEKAYAEI
jgi:alcohol dehydrogenase